MSTVVGCSGGSIGDPPTQPAASEFGTGSKICDVVGTATWVDSSNQASTGCQQPPDRAVHITGATIVAIDRFDETNDGATGNYYLESTPCNQSPYSGVTVYRPSMSPPDLRLAVGDAVDLDGTSTEFIGPSSSPFGQCRTLPELSGTLSFRFDKNGDLTPLTISTADLASYDKARQYIGMLVRVENVTLAADGANSSGRYSATINVGGGVSLADVPKIANELYDIEKQGPTLQAQTTFQAVTGIVTYFYGFHLSPRSPADFEQ